MKKLILGYKLSSVVLIAYFLFSPLAILAQESPFQDIPTPEISSSPVGSSETSIGTLPETPVEESSSSPSVDPSFDPFFLDTSESQSEIGIQEEVVSDIEPTPDEVLPEKESEEPPPALLGGEETESLPGGLNGQFSSEFKKPETDLSTGALTYQYPIQIPPGRNGMQPDISLLYNNQSANNIGNIMGYGWSLSIPYIERLNKTGIEDVYMPTYATSSFRSSLSGDLNRISSGSYGAQTDDSSFIRYILSSGSWSLTDKDGKTYLFGQTASSQQDNTLHTKTHKWLLNKVTDTNGNFITYEYFKNAGQIYPATISWTGFGADAGIFKLHFELESRTDNDIYHTNGFGVRNNYRISRIEARINNSWVHRYDLDYGTGDNGRRSVLTSIIESGRTEDTVTTTTLPAVQFSYTVPEKGWQSTSDATPQFEPVGAQFADVNGDGMIDGIDSKACSGCSPSEQLTYQKTYLYLATGSEGFTLASPQYVPPVIFYNDYVSPKDRGVRADDLNGDFKADIYMYHIYAGGNTASVSINNGTGWTASNSWSPLVPVIDSTTTGATYLFDANGDGLPDVFRSGSSGQVRRLNSGSGWATTSLTTPVNLNEKVYIFDANGDGFNDMVHSTGTGIGGVYLFTGSSWEKDTNFATISIQFSDSSSDSGARIADVNGDGLPDIIYGAACASTSSVYLNTGTGWSIVPSWELPLAFICSGFDQGVRIIDFTGDGMPDIAGAYKNKGEKADQLKTITFPQGGVATVEYQSSHRYRDANNNLLNRDLPVILSTVRQIKLDPIYGTISSQSFRYEKGDYYYNGAYDRRNAGFGKVTTIDSGSQTVTYFHQGNGASSAWSEPTDHKSKIGKAFRIDVSDRSGNLYKRTWNNWTAVSLGQDRWFSVLASTQEQIYDGNSSHKDTVASYSYDSTNGNLTTKTEYGEVTGSSTDSSFTDIGTDKYTTAFSYAASISKIYLPSTITKSDQSSNRINEVRNYYDSQSLGVLTKGNLTKQESWKSESSYIDIERTYNSRGLITQEKDPRDKIASFSYDSTFIYPVRSENALGYNSSRSFDHSSGKVKRLLDPNNLTFENVYDGLDRLIEEKQPEISEDEGESLMGGGGGESLMLGGEGIGEYASVSDMIEGRSASERATIKGQEIAKIGSIERTSIGDYDIEVVSMDSIYNGIQVFARAWDKNGQIGFGEDGSVDIERFRIINPPILVGDPEGDISRVYEYEGEEIINHYREDLSRALLQSLEHTIQVKQQKFGDHNIIEGKIGNTTTTVYPDANPESTSVDGIVTRDPNSPFENWSTIRNTATAIDVSDVNALDDMARLADASGTSTWTNMTRGVFLFNTSSINDDDSVVSAVFSLYSYAHQNDHTQSIYIVSASPASNTSLGTGDYDDFGTTSFSTPLSCGSVTDAAYNDFPLNMNGLLNITVSGVSKFGVRLSGDVTNTEPSFQAGEGNSKIVGYFADETGTTKDPKLVVEHNSGSPTATAATKATYIYNDTPGGVRIKVMEYLNASISADTYQYFDGLNRKLQERKEAESSYSVRDFQYNNRGGLGKETVPYFSSGTSRTSATGDTTLYSSHSYDPLLRLSRIDNAIGSTSYTYDDWKLLIRDARGKNKYIFNDAYNNLTRVDEINSGASYSTNYTYNGNNNLTRITDALGNIRNFTYDGLGRRLTAQDLHDPSDATFGSWTYAYDLSGNLASSSDPKSQRIDYTYDDTNRVLTENYTGQSGTEVTYTYDTCTNGIGSLCQVISPGASISYKYGVLRHKTQERNKIGSTTYQTDFAYNRQGNMLTMANPDSSEVKYNYNLAGQLETIQRKESTDGAFIDVITDFNYAPHSKIASMSFENCVTTVNTYDATKVYRLTNISTISNTCVGGDSLMGGGGGEGMMMLGGEGIGEYVSVSDMIEGRSASERATIKGQEIAKIGSIERTGVGDYEIEIVAMDPIHYGVQVFARAWDKNGQIGFGEDGTVDIERFRLINPPILVEDPKGDIERTNVYEEETIIDTFREDLTQALLQSLEHTIQVKQQKFSDENIIEGKIGNTTTTVYPDANPESTSVDGIVTRDPNSPFENWSTIRNTATAIDVSDVSALNDIARLADANSASTWTNMTRGVFLFDTSSIADDDSIVSGVLSLYAYAHQNDHTQSIYIVSASPASNTGLGTGDYDDFGTTSFSTPLSCGSVTDAAYNNFSLNASGLSALSLAGVSKFGVRLSGDVTNTEPSFQAGEGNSKIVGYFADETGTTTDPKLVVEHTANTAATTSLQYINYTYDVNNNITRIVDDSSTNAAKLATISYDDLNRVTRVQVGSVSFGGNFTHTYGYDALGNITSKSDEGIYTYATQSFGGAYANPHAVYNISRTASFSYDTNGNLTNVASNSSNIATMSWDYKNRMNRYKSSTASMSYSYDHEGQRILVNNDTTITHYPTKFYNYDGTTRIKHIFTPDGLLVAMVKGTGASVSLHYIHTDHLGGTNVVTNASGSMESLNDYYAFGETRIETGSPNEQRGFTGYEENTDIGMNYAGQRYQSGKWGRFVSQDSVFQAIGDMNRVGELSKKKQRDILADPQLLNSYSYARNNPLIMKDESGGFAQVALATPFVFSNPVGWAIGAAAVVGIGITAGVVLYKSGAFQEPDYFNESRDKTENFINGLKNSPNGQKIIGAGLVVIGLAVSYYDELKNSVEGAVNILKKKINSTDSVSPTLISPPMNGGSSQPQLPYNSSTNNTNQSLNFVPSSGGGGVWVNRPLTSSGICCKTSTWYEWGVANGRRTN